MSYREIVAKLLISGAIVAGAAFLLMLIWTDDADAARRRQPDITACFRMVGEVNGERLRAHRYLSITAARKFSEAGWELTIRDPKHCDRELLTGFGLPGGE